MSLTMTGQHRYKLDGRFVDGVTTVINTALPKPGLMYWAARTVAEYVADADPHDLEVMRAAGRGPMVALLKGVPWEQSQTKRIRGTEVHAYAARLVRGERCDAPPDHLAAHVESCLKFLDTWRVAPVLVETKVGSRTYGYAGTFDLVADLPDGRRALIDYKCSERVYPDIAIQLAAYRYADFYLWPGDTETPMDALGINATYAVLLGADDFEVRPVETPPAVFEVFRALLFVARRISGLAEYIGEAEAWEPTP